MRSMISRLPRHLAFATACVTSLACASTLAHAAEAAKAAAPAAEADAPQVPGDDIFGFSNTTDPGNKGDLQYFNENDGRAGKRDGSYGALNSKFAIGYTFADNWWVGGALFSAYNQASNVTGIANVDHLRFDGASVELLHRIIERSASNPFAMTLSVEPRWSLNDGVTGLPSQAYQSTFKIFMDAPVLADTIYWGGNIQYTIQTAQDPINIGQHLASSQLMLSSALTWQAGSNFFFGGEARFFTLSDNYTLSHEVGRALYIGPAALWKATDKIAFNVTYQPQVYGRSSTSPNQSLDLDNFERAQFRAKLNVNF
jgi:hypothetical protein